MITSIQPTSVIQNLYLSAKYLTNVQSLNDKIILSWACSLCTMIYIWSNVMECWGKFLLCLTRVNKSEMHSLNWLFPHHKTLCTNFISCRMQNDSFLSLLTMPTNPSQKWTPNSFDWVVRMIVVCEGMRNSCLALPVYLLLGPTPLFGVATSCNSGS